MVVVEGEGGKRKGGVYKREKEGRNSTLAAVEE